MMQRSKRYLLLIAGILSLLMLAGCKPTPEGAVEDFYAAMQGKDYSKALTYTVKSDDKKIALAEFINQKKWGLDMAMPYLKYKTTESEENGDSAKVRVQVTQVDYEKILNEGLTDSIKDSLKKDPSLLKKDLQESAKDILTPFLQKKLNTNAPKKTKEVVIYLKKNNDKWLLVDNGLLEEAVLGNGEKAFNPPPELTVIGFFEAFKAKNLNLAGSYIYAMDTDLNKTFGDTREIAELIFAKMDYDVINKEIKDTEAKVTVKVTTPDCEKLFQPADLENYIKKRLQNEPGLAAKLQTNKGSSEIATEYFKEKLNTMNYPTITNKAVLNLQTVGNKWLLVNEDNLVKVIMGNLDKVNFN